MNEVSSLTLWLRKIIKSKDFVQQEINVIILVAIESDRLHGAWHKKIQYTGRQTWTCNDAHLVDKVCR